MNDSEIVKLLIRKDERIEALQEENRKLKEALAECVSAIEWHMEHSTPVYNSEHGDFFNISANAVVQAKNINT